MRNKKDVIVPLRHESDWSASPSVVTDDTTIAETLTRGFCYLIIALVIGICFYFSDPENIPECLRTTLQGDPSPRQNEPTDYLTLAAEKVGGSVMGGKWLVWREKSAIADRSHLFVALFSEKGLKEEGEPQFAMGCVDNQTTATFGFDNKFTREGRTRIEYAIDTQPITKEEWLIIDERCVFSFDAIPFLKSLSGGKKLTVRGYPTKGSSMELSFDIEGIASILPLIQNECGWK